MRTYQAFRYELKPNNRQVGLLIKHCGVARFAWNWALARRIELYKTHKGKERFTNAMKQHRELNALKKSEYP
jgi:putative transposase